VSDKDQSATFAIDLEDGTSGPAVSAVRALKDLRGQIDADTKALAEMQRAMKNLQLGTSVNVAQFRELKDRIDQKKQAIASAQSAYIGLGGTFKRVSSGGRETASYFAELARQAQGLPGPLGSVVSKLGGLRGLVVGGAIALGIAAIGASMVALAAASTVAVAALLKYGIAQADARRSELLRLEGLTKIRSWYGLAAGNAGEMQRAIDSVSASSALGRDEIAKYSSELYRMGLRGDNLTAALEGVAIKASVQGEAQARMFAGWAAGAALTGHSVRKLADDVKARLGGIAARQMLSLEVQSKKMREAFAALFSGLKLEGFLEGLNEVTSLFGQSTASGRALKSVLEGVLQPMIGGLEYLAPIGKRFFQGMVIGALLLGIHFLKLRNYLQDVFGGSELFSQFDLMETALWAGVFVVGALAGGLTVATAAFAAFAGGIALAFAPLVGFVTLVSKVASLWADTDWDSLGFDITSGIVNGIKSGANWVTETVKGLGKSAFAAFKAALGIASPSKEFAKLGKTLPQGIAVGIRAGSDTSDRAVEGMISIPEASGASDSAPQASAAPGGRSAGPITVSIGDIHVHSQSDKPREMAFDLKRELEQILEGVAIRMGAPV
jgi:hypothetical protein